MQFVVVEICTVCQGLPCESGLRSVEKEPAQMVYRFIYCSLQTTCPASLCLEASQVQIVLLMEFLP